MKPFAESCEQNKGPILAVLREVFADRSRVLEIASGTGQHAVHFGRAMPHLLWQTSELAHNHGGIRAWLDEAALSNVLAPVEIDVDHERWPVDEVDAVFNANTVHIVSWRQVERMFAGIGRVLVSGGVLCLYGPFNYGGCYSAASNARFDAWLKARDPDSGVRDFEALNGLAEAQGMILAADLPMPADNRTLVWKKH
jgi:SAM-dependent methyltransferase